MAKFIADIALKTDNKKRRCNEATNLTNSVFFSRIAPTKSSYLGILEKQQKLFTIPAVENPSTCQLGLPLETVPSNDAIYHPARHRRPFGDPNHHLRMDAATIPTHTALAAKVGQSHL
jgi:hypothetical protein